MRRGFLAAAVAAAVLGVAACGGGDDDSVATEPATEAAPAPAAEAPIVSGLECRYLPGKKEFLVQADVANPGEIATLYAFTATINKGGGDNYYGPSVAVVVPPKSTTQAIAGFRSNDVEMAANEPCSLDSHDSGQFEVVGGVAWSDAVIDQEVQEGLVRAAVNADSCSGGEPQCASEIQCDPATELIARCDITFVGAGSRSEFGAKEVVFDVSFDPATGAFSHEYIR